MSGQGDSFDGAAHERLGQVIAGIDFVRQEQWRIVNRLAEGERRMDWLSEEAVRLRTLFDAAQAQQNPPTHHTLHPAVQVFIWIVDWFKDLFSERGAFKRWLILFIVAWATNKLHLPTAWSEALQRVIGP